MKNKNVEDILQNKILPFVSKPGRYTGNEINAVHKDPESVSVRIALAFPEVYELAMSYVGFEILYHILNKEKDFWAERVYAPWKDMEERMRKENLPLFSLESFTSLKEFDWIGFTLQYELTYTNILNMLDLAKIPLLSKDRGINDPLIIGGGPCTGNPEPMAEFFDAFLIGDGEEAVTEICRAIQKSREMKFDRNSTLARLSKIRGVYIPQFFEPVYVEGRFSELRKIIPEISDRVQTRILPELKADYYPIKPLVPLIEATHDRLAVEVMRGCSEGCRYCNAGMIYRPVRERQPHDVISQISDGIRNSGYEEVSFLSLSISDYTSLPELMSDARVTLDTKKINVSFPSMRLDNFTEKMAEFVSSVRKSGFTFAPEAGSERLRKVINKNITDDDLFRSVGIALNKGWKQLKFYFMIGLPTETEEDIEAIAVLMEKVVRCGKMYGKIKYHVSLSPFSPKPHTPFQWERQNSMEELQSKIDLLRNKFSRMRQIKFSWRDPEVSLIECILGRGDRRMSAAIRQAWEAGSVFDGWTDYFSYSTWKTAFSNSGLKVENYITVLSIDDPLPWDHIDKGVSKTFLKSERQNAYSEIVVQDCKAGQCLACGIQRKGGFAELAVCYKSPDGKKAESKTEAAVPFSIPNNESKDVPVISQFYRVRFAKKEYGKYLSHLDIVRAFERACRHSEIPLIYSQGFNPHPRMSFAPPLSLGYTSEAEYVDLEISAAYQKNLLIDLNRYLPEGIFLTDMKVINRRPDTLSELINSSLYRVNLDERVIREQSFDKALEQLLDAEQIIVSRNTKGIEKNIDIRPYIVSIDKMDRSIRIKTRYLDKRTVRLKEIINELIGENFKNGFYISVHRVEQLINKNGLELTPLEILP